MTNREALLQAFNALAPYSDKQRWEFDNNMVHLNYITQKISRDKTIFDAGCGIGILAVALSLLGYKVAGGDKYLFKSNNQFFVSDIKGLEEIWKKHNVAISDKDMINDAVEQTYDAILSVATIEHQPDPKKFLEKLLRCLNVGGYIYIATPNVAHALNRVRFLFGLSPLAHNTKDFFMSGVEFTGHWREYTLDELKQFFSLLKVDIVDATHIQSRRPFRRWKGVRNFYLDCFALVAYLISGARDTNVIFGKKVLSV